MAKSKFSLTWMKRAQRDIHTIGQNIENSYSKQRADKYIAGLLEKCDRLKTSPEHYPPCRLLKLRNAGFRCFTYRKQYIVVYNFIGKQVTVLAVMGARRNPNDFEKLI